MNHAQAITLIASRRIGSPRTIIGAVAPPGTNWNISDYEKEGDTVYENFGKKLPAIVTVQKNGPGIIESFPTSEEASKAYDDRVAAPGAAWWIGLYNASLAINGESPRRDETYLGGLTVDETVTVKTNSDHTTLIPIAIGSVLALGMLIATGKKAHR